MGEMVSFEANGRRVEGYLATPSAPGPGVVVVQEWWGLVPHIQDVCDRFAAHGFLALAPDLYHGVATTEPDEAGKLMMQLKQDAALADLSGAVEHLRQMAVGGAVGATGFCMGGALTLALAAKGGVAAAVPFYGIPREDPGYEEISCPVLGHYAELDGWTPDEVQALFADLRSKGVQAVAHIYPGTSHAFFNSTRPRVYDEAAAQLAWARTLGFFREHLV